MRLFGRLRNKHASVPDVGAMRRDSIGRGERIRSDLNEPDEESHTLERAVRFDRSGRPGAERSDVPRQRLRPH
jgi:hypothetical protein